MKVCIIKLIYKKSQLLFVFKILSIRESTIEIKMSNLGLSLLRLKFEVTQVSLFRLISSSQNSLIVSPNKLIFPVIGFELNLI